MGQAPKLVVGLAGVKFIDEAGIHVPTQFVQAGWIAMECTESQLERQVDPLSADDPPIIGLWIRQ